MITLSPRYDTGLHFEKKYIAANGAATGAIEYEHYLYAGGQMFGKYITTTATDGVTQASTATEYYSRDNLGSMVAITDATGTVTQRMSYDIWGKRRYPNGFVDAGGLLNNPDMVHGFTGHEMLDDFELIHMNGRLYDPVMARFVSADFLVQSPDNLQSFNRYSYGWNNPLSGTDPSGQCWGPTCWIQKPLASLGSGVASVWRTAWRSEIGQAAIQITIATYGGPSAIAAYNAAYTKYQGGSWGDAAKAAAITYATTQAFNAVGGETGHQPIFGTPEYMANVAGHAFVGCVSAAAGGGDCGSGAMAAGFGAAAAPFAIGLGSEGGTIASAIIGGTASVLGGGRFANGAVTGAFGYLYNYCARGGCTDKPFSWGAAATNWLVGDGARVTDVNASEIPLTGATYVDNKDGTYGIHTLSPIYGTVTGVLNTDGTMSIMPDRYNFDQKRPVDSVKIFVRNGLTAVGLELNGRNGRGYLIEFTGTIPAPKDLQK